MYGSVNRAWETTKNQLKFAFLVLLNWHTVHIEAEFLEREISRNRVLFL